MDPSSHGTENFCLSSDEDDLFDENLDLFDHEQFGIYEDGIKSSEVDDDDEYEMDEELEDSEDQLYIEYEDFDKELSPNDLSEMDDYDDLED